MSTVLDAFSGLLSQNKGLLQDFAKAATDLSQAQAAQSATLAALAQIIPQSLLNYLK